MQLLILLLMPLAMLLLLTVKSAAEWTRVDSRPSRGGRKTRDGVSRPRLGIIEESGLVIERAQRGDTDAATSPGPVVAVGHQQRPRCPVAALPEHSPVLERLLESHSSSVSGEGDYTAAEQSGPIQ
ncbi:unnamed protein product [Lampetra fluviatilis]